MDTSSLTMGLLVVQRLHFCYLAHDSRCILDQVASTVSVGSDLRASSAVEHSGEVSQDGRMLGAETVHRLVSAAQMMRQVQVSHAFLGA